MTLPKQSRRRFLATSAAAAGGVIGHAACRQSLQPLPPPPPSPVSSITAPPDVADQLTTSATPQSPIPMPTRLLGRTEMTVPVLGLGGSASPLSKSGQAAEAIAIIEHAYEGGIRYFDTAANYGPSEERLGQVLPAVRSEVMIATKTSQRTRDEAWRQLERSLTRLQTD